MPDTEDTAAAPAPAAKRAVRTPGGTPAPAPVVEAAEAGFDEDMGTDDARTPGLKVLEDGAIEYQGKVHRRPFDTPHGLVVPPASVEPGGAMSSRR